MMIRLALTMALLVLPSSASAQPVRVAATAGRYASDLTHSSLTFRVRHMGLSNYTARFKKLEAILDFDPVRPERSRLTATVDTGSIETDYPNKNPDWNGELARDAKFFNSKIFPQARFVSTAVRRTGPRTAAIIGKLTLLGVTRPLTLNATYNGSIAAHPFAKVPALGFSARGTLKRSRWGLNFGIGKELADEVEIIIETELVRQGPAK